MNIKNANVERNKATKDKNGTIEGKGNAKVSVNSSSLGDLAINMASGSSLDASGSSISGGSIAASNASINFSNTTVSKDALSILSNGTLQLDSSHIAGGSLALASASSVIADAGNSQIDLQVVNPGNLTVNQHARLDTFGYTEAGGVTKVNGVFMPVYGLTVQQGLLTGAGVIVGNVIMGGALRPGDMEPGTMTITGNYTQLPSGVLQEFLQGPGVFGQTSISGMATLGGTLDIDLTNGFVPTLGETFKIMEFGSSLGTFSDIEGRYIGNGEEFAVLYDPMDVTLEVVEAAPTPEPASLVMFGSGFVCLSVFLRKRLCKTA